MWSGIKTGGVLVAAAGWFVVQWATEGRRLRPLAIGAGAVALVAVAGVASVVIEDAVHDIALSTDGPRARYVEALMSFLAETLP